MPHAPERPLPVIAVTCGHAVVDAVPRVRTNATYVRAVERAGGVALLVPPFAGVDAARAAHAVLERVDGLLLTGGEDVDPALYGAARHPACDEPDPVRDRTEIALVRRAADVRLPLLAVCRGIQVLNVAFGGTLVQDIPSECASDTPHRPGGERDARCHAVAVAADSRLAAALGATRLDVNSLHHQAPARTGASLRVVATSPDGLTEGLEPADPSWWAVAVQWHPEELAGGAEGWDRALLAEFVRRAASRGRPTADPGPTPRPTASAWPSGPGA